MRAVRRNEHETTLDDVPAPAPGPGETLVRVECAGVCRTDLHVARGRLAARTPLVLGHELSGTRPDGVAVTVVPWLSCGACAPVDPPRCDRPTFLGVDRDGAFAEYVVVPTAAVLPLPKHVPFRRGAFVEPLAAAMAVRNAPIVTTQRGLVHGHGRIADLTVRVLRAAGFAHVDTMPGAAYDFVIDTEGTAASLHESLRLAAIGGRVILKSRPFAPVAFDVALAVRREISLHAVNYGAFREAVAWLAEDRVEVDDLFDEPARLEDFARVFDQAEAPHAKKQFFAPAAR